MTSLRWVFVLFLFQTVALFGCGKANDKAPAVDSIGKHPAAWVTLHRAAYQQNHDLCRDCHGIDLKGGVTKVDCFNQAGLGRCHAGGHGPRVAPHQLPFRDGGLHGPEAKKDLVYCQSCHGTSGGPGSNPRFNVPLGALEKGCEDCHKANTAHPPLPDATTGWIGHTTAGSMGNSCTLCHGADLAGSPDGSVFGCNKCHTKLVPGIIPTLGACNSCHDAKPASGSHTPHTNALAGVTGACGACHDGAGSGTVKHANSTKDVAFASTYNARSATATRNSDGSCSNVSCHGGIKTPVWGGNLTHGCLSCHSAGSAQNNSYRTNVGKHNKHIIEVGLQCTDCHDINVTVSGASHYSGMGTNATFVLPASATIRVPGYTSVNPSCNPGRTTAAGTYSVSVCHGTERW